jgi:hypothetical protein
VNIAVTQMDEVTQQNAALVEEASAAAQSLEEQAAQLKGLVASFKIDAANGGAGAQHAARNAARGSAPVSPAPKRSASTAKARVAARPASATTTPAPADTGKVAKPAPAKAMPSPSTPIKTAAVDADSDWETF